MENVTQTTMEGPLHLYQKGRRKNKKQYALLIPTSQSGVARLELYENERLVHSHKPALMVVGSDVVKVEMVTMSCKEARNSFLISTRNEHYTFSHETTEGCNVWVKAIREIFLGEGHGQQYLSEINDIYESAEGSSSQMSEFLVTIDENTRTKMGMDGKVKLVVEDESITIISLSGKKIVRWNLKDIRRFTFTSKMLFLDAGRKSTLGAGDFVFHYDDVDSIKALINTKKAKLKQKLVETRHHTAPVPSIGHPPVSRVAEPDSYWENIGIYETLQEVVSHPSTKQKDAYVGKAHSLQQPPTSLNSHALPTTSRLPSGSSPTSRSPVVKEHTSQIRAVYGNEAQTEIYSEPQTITDAWRTNAFDDSEDMALYSNLKFSCPEEKESHYWQGNGPVPPADVMKERRENQQTEDIYAVVDHSKKAKNRK